VTKAVFKGEIGCLDRIQKLAPGFCPKPIGWGRYTSNPDAHFLLCGFVEMQDVPMDPVKLPRRLAELHRKGVAADGLYGADEVIAGGVLPVRPARSSSWEDYFLRYVRVLMRLEEIAQGPRPAEFVRL
jgi:protein-ribulosamine 3-kinase